MKDAIESIGDSARQLVVERPGFVGGARRDVHVKHHGLVLAELTIAAGLSVDAAQGVFAAPKKYRAWVRFSSSSKTAQSDRAADGRGVAIKLIELPGGPRNLDDPGAQEATQDFIFLNGRSFFARNADDMKTIANLQARDRFPSLFFFSLRPSRLRALRGALAMVLNQADSPLGLTYWSQTPYMLGQRLVKYKLTPVESAALPKNARTDANYLFLALKKYVEDGQQAFSFKLEVIFANKSDEFDKEGDRADDATRIWNEDTHVVEHVATLEILPQRFATAPRMRLAEQFSYNPYNGLEAHAPRGGINHARLVAYKASAAARAAGNGTPAGTPAYDGIEWLGQQTNGDDDPFTPPSYPDTGTLDQLRSLLAQVTPNFALWISKFMESPLAYALAPGLLAVFLLFGWRVPGGLAKPFAIPLNWLLTSESLIPGVTPGRELPAPGTPVYDFRYGAVGTEDTGGIPYWVFRALPRMCPSLFGERDDYSAFGFDTPDDDTYYADYHKLPRGFVLTKDTQYSLAGTVVSINLSRVALNCATCHRGEYIDKGGVPTFVDGMPSQRIDTSGYQLAVFDCVQSEQFNGDHLVATIDALLAKDHPGTTPPTLSFIEKFAYEAIADKMKAATESGSIAWKKLRAPMGPGRIDAFNALRYEFLPPDPGPDTGDIVATVDLPSIWHEGNDWRPWHHWDGNTADGVARSYGAVIGVGGTPLSIRRYDVKAVTKWIDTALGTPPYPFDLPTGWRKTGEDKGKTIYESSCADCHGHYDVDLEGKTKLRSPAPPCMRGGEIGPTWPPVGSDPKRAQAVDASLVAKLNQFGVDAGVWTETAFRSTRSYQCPPLDGIWARAPYLHNGSVPTLRDLLSSPDKRPGTFYRGSAWYLPDDGGFENTRADVYAPEDAVKPIPGSLHMPVPFLYDTALLGNGNQGHPYGHRDDQGSRDFTPEEITQLIDYLYGL